MGLLDRARAILTQTATDPGAVSAHVATDSADAQALAAAPRQVGGPGVLTNLLSGLNTSADSAWWDQWFQRRSLTEVQRRAMGLDPFIDRLLSLPGDDATREGWRVLVGSDSDDSRDAASKAIADYEQREGITLSAQLRAASTRSRQYGAALILLGIDDGRPPDQPVDVDKIRRIWWAKTIDWRDFDYGKVIGPRGTVDDYGQLDSADRAKYEVGAQKFGQVETYLVTDLSGVLPDGIRDGDGHTSCGAQQTLAVASYEIHADRVLYVPYKNALPLLDQMQDAIAAYFRGLSGISRAIDRASLVVWKIADNVAKSWSENRSIGQSRIQAAMRSWSAMSAIVIDKEHEDFVNVGSGSTAGLADSIYPLMTWLSALSGVPIIRLFGESPGGFGTGEAEREQYNDLVRALQDDMSTLIRKFGRYVLAAADSGIDQDVDPDTIEVEFEDLDPPTEAERGEMMAALADVAVKLKDLFLASELQKLFPEIELDKGARTLIRSREIASQSQGLAASQKAISAAAVDIVLKIAQEAKVPIDVNGARVIATAAGVAAPLAAEIFPLAIAPLEDPALAPGEETPDNPDGEGADPAVDAPAPEPTPVRLIPPDAETAPELAGSLGIPSRRLSLLAERGTIRRYTRLDGKPLYSRGEVLRAEARLNMTPEEIAAEDAQAAELEDAASE